MRLKFCNKCQQEKPQNEFHKAKNNKDGLQRRCAQCNSETVKQYYKNNINNAKKKYKNRASGFKQDIYDKTNKIKSSRGCLVCFDDDSCVLDFHHLNPIDKTFPIAHLVLRKNWKKIEEEIAKCIVICSNCHRRYHAGRFSLLTDNPSS